MIMASEEFFMMNMVMTGDPFDFSWIDPRAVICTIIVTAVIFTILGIVTFFSTKGGPNE